MNRHVLFYLCCWFALCSVCFGNVIGSRETSCTKDTLGNLKLAFQRYYAEYATLPTGDFPTVLAALTGSGTDAQNPRKVVFFEFRTPRPRSRFWRDDAVPGDRSPAGLPVDAWGQPIICTIDSASSQVTLRSFGRNGRDDAGQPDDIAFTYSPKQ